MNFKQNKARLDCYPDEVAPRRPPPDGAPTIDSRAARGEVATRGDTRLDTVVEGWDGDVVWVRVGGTRIPLLWVQVDGASGFALPSGRVVIPVVGPRGCPTEVLVGGRSLFVEPTRIAPRTPLRNASDCSNLVARMDGRVVCILVRPGDRVAVGQPVMVLEAMKMEDAIRVPVAAIVREVRAAEGDRVRRDQTLLVLDPIADSS